MDQAKRKELERRRSQLQFSKRIDDYLETDLRPYLEILDHFTENGIAYRIEQLAQVPLEWLSHINAIIERLPYSDYGFTKQNGENEENTLLNKVWQSYPSTNFMRYVPDLPQVSDLREVVLDLNLADQNVYFYYLRYLPIIELRLYDLIEHGNDELFNSWHGDVIIFPEDLNWLIAFSLEEEWYGGKLKH